MNDQQPVQAPPSNYLVFAILTTIFCSLIFGIISIVYAAQVNTKWYSGDYQGAIDASRNAKIWAWVSFGIGFFIRFIVIIISLLFMFAGIGTSMHMFNM